MARADHGMIFHRFDGTPMVVLHHPNRSPNERALLFELEDDGDTLVIVRKLSTEHPFANPDLSMEARVDNLLSLMTLDEKIACLVPSRTCRAWASGARATSRDCTAWRWVGHQATGGDRRPCRRRSSRRPSAWAKPGIPT